MGGEAMGQPVRGGNAEHGRTRDWYRSRKIRSLLISHLLSEVGGAVGRVEVGSLK